MQWHSVRGHRVVAVHTASQAPAGNSTNWHSVHLAVVWATLAATRSDWPNCMQPLGSWPRIQYILSCNMLHPQIIHQYHEATVQMRAIQREHSSVTVLSLLQPSTKMHLSLQWIEAAATAAIASKQYTARGKNSYGSKINGSPMSHGYESSAWHGEPKSTIRWTLFNIDRVVAFHSSKEDIFGATPVWFESSVSISQVNKTKKWLEVDKT